MTGAKGRIREETLRALRLPAANRKGVNIAAAADAKPAGASQRQRPGSDRGTEGADGPSPGGGSVVAQWGNQAGGTPGKQCDRPYRHSGRPSGPTGSPNRRCPTGRENLRCRRRSLRRCRNSRSSATRRSSISFLVCVALPAVGIDLLQFIQYRNTWPSFVFGDKK